MAMAKETGFAELEGPRPTARTGEMNALLGRGSEFEGKLVFEGTVKIDGKFTGDINSEGTLIVGEGARVKAEIAVDTVIIQGEVFGNIKAKSLVELHSTARLKGNIHAPGLVVERGAMFDGNCVMEGRDSQSRGGPPAPPPPSTT